ncbi:LTA synthase family protein [Listeria sp. PSOL-1]|uniref:LTA synthase family protein n=1 Tax=Listeria sp. PSOL-1 TaxID=1844999 RepID=UPI0013D23A3C|nr:LTA synthase family protein [Listeria sp. PSOL-1]
MKSTVLKVVGSSIGNIILYLLLTASIYPNERISAFQIFAFDHLLSTLFSLLFLEILFLLLYLIVPYFFTLFAVWVVSFVWLIWIGATKFSYRLEPLFPSDFTMGDQVGDLSHFVSAKILILLIIITLVLIACGVFLDFRVKANKHLSLRSKLILKGCALLLLAGMVWQSYTFNSSTSVLQKIVDDVIIDWNPVHQEGNYKANGYLPGFLYNMPKKSMEKPANYSRQTMQQLVKKYQKVAENLNQKRTFNNFQNDNVIFVMSESFSNPLRLSGVTAPQNLIPYTQDIEQNNIGGKVLSAGYGGGTANIEFEALTGFSMSLFKDPSIVPYQTFVSSMANFPSIVHEFDENDYTTTAIHPYNTSMYKRMEAYPNLGFQSFLSDKQMKGSEHLDNSEYASDSFAYQQALLQLQSTTSPNFIHLVTMQNHMPYWNKYNQVIPVSINGQVNTEASNYAEGIHQTDTALKPFIQQLNQLSKEVIVVFWGDHLPGYYDGYTQNINGPRKMHETELFIYDNKKHVKGNLKTTSPIYFGNELKKLTNSKLTVYQAFLESLRAEIPAFDSGVYVDSKNNTVKAEELSRDAKEKLQELKLFQYDILEGKGFAKHDLFKVPSSN